MSIQKLYNWLYNIQICWTKKEKRIYIYKYIHNYFNLLQLFINSKLLFIYSFIWKDY